MRLPHTLFITLLSVTLLAQQPGSLDRSINATALATPRFSELEMPTAKASRPLNRP